MTGATNQPINMDTLATDGILPFNAFVQHPASCTRSGWTSISQGASIEWLREEVQGIENIFGEARIMSPYGAILI